MDRDVNRKIENSNESYFAILDGEIIGKGYTFEEVLEEVEKKNLGVKELRRVEYYVKPGQQKPF